MVYYPLMKIALPASFTYVNNKLLHIVNFDIPTNYTVKRVVDFDELKQDMLS